jgi:hypothetical protein
MVKKGPKPTYQRVIPKFLQQYTHLLQPERRPEYDEEAPTIASSSKPSSESAAATAEAAPAAADDPFDGYTEEETAALEEYAKKHPERVVDKAALRAQVKALTSSLAGSSEQQVAAAVGEKRKAESEADAAAAAELAAPLEYINEEGSIKFNKPTAAATAAAAAAAGKASGKKRSKKAAAAAVKNTSLLSFDDDEE